MKLKSQCGMAMVEFALVLPVLCILLFGMIEFGLILYNKSIIADASRLGARYGTVLAPTYKTTSAVVTYTQNYCSGKLVSFSGSTPSVTVTATPSVTPPSFGATLTVTVNFIFTDLVIHNLIGLSSPNHKLTATTVMSYE